MSRYVLALIFLGACSTAPIEISTNGPGTTSLDVALETWALKEPAHYRFTMRMVDDFGCKLPEHILTVRNGRVISVERGRRSNSCELTPVTRTNRDHRESKPLSSNVTITALLARFANAKTEYPKISIEELYNLEYGFPIRWQLDPSGISKNLGDGGYGFRITRFEILANDV